MLATEKKDAGQPLGFRPRASRGNLHGSEGGWEPGLVVDACNYHAGEIEGEEL